MVGRLIASRLAAGSGRGDWPDSFKPAQTIAEESASSRKPKAAPCGQLKRVMNWA